MDEIGLPAQEGRRLQHIDHCSHVGHFLSRVHIGKDGHAKLLADLGEDLQTFFHTHAAIGGTRTPVGLVVAGLVDERNRQFGANFLERRRGFKSHLAGLDDAGPRNQEKRLVEANIEAAEFHGDSFQPPC